MSPRDLFGVAIRTLAIATIAGGVSVTLVGLLGPFSPLLMGVALFVGAGPIVALAYGTPRNGPEFSREP